jgi:hypothetical protein
MSPPKEAESMKSVKRSPSRLLPAAVLVAVFALAAPVARAQEPPPPGPSIDDELAQTIEQIMVRRLETHLELSEDQKETVVPMIHELTDLRRTHSQRRREGLRTIAVMARDSGVDEKLLKSRLESFYREQDEYRRQEARLADQIRAGLDVRQQARLLMFEERFRNEMRRRFEDARRLGGPRRGQPRRPGEPPPR